MNRVHAAFFVFVALAASACTVDTDDNVLTPDATVTADQPVDSTPDVAPDVAPDPVADPQTDPDVASDLAPDTSEDDGGDVVNDAVDADGGDPDLVRDTTFDDGGDAADAADADPCAVREPPDMTSGPWIYLGTGFLEFEATPNCGEVPFVLGGQGGAHIWGAFQVGGFEPSGDYFLSFRFRQNGDTVAQLTLQSWFPTDCIVETGTYTCTGYRVVLDEGLQPEELLDIPGELDIRFWQEGGLDLTETIVVIPNDVTF